MDSLKTSSGSGRGRIEMNDMKSEKRLLLDPNGTDSVALNKNLTGKKSYAALSCIISNKKMKTTDAYENLMGKERPVGILFYCLFLVLCPLTFRYAMMASVTKTSAKPKLKAVGNATLEMITDWKCSPCTSVAGITLSSLKIRATNITSPNKEAGFPSIAVFASQDLKTWYNYYSPVSVGSAYFKNYKDSTININETSGAACLGSVYNNYLVACLNLNNYASQFKGGDFIALPPFNDRCFQIAGTCGIPCATLDKVGGGRKIQEPPHCHNGQFNIGKLIGNVTNDNTVNSQGDWGSSLTIFDWITLLTIFFDTVGNIMRYLPILCGRPADVESAKSVQCSGAAVVGCSTPIVSENEAIFLRGMVGRTLTILHTIGSRHNIKGLYLDCIVNEFRGKGEDKRIQMWCAWVQFCEVLAAMKTRQMSWEHNLANDDEKAAAHHLLTESNKKARVIRSLRTRRDTTVQWDCGLANVTFEGVSSTKETFYDAVQVAPAAVKVPELLTLKAKSYDSGMLQPEFVQSDMVTRMPSRVHVNLEDLLPLICFLDGWLEEIKVKDPTYNYKDKTEALKAMFNDAPSQKYFYGEQLLEVQERLLLLFDIFNGDKVQPVPEEGFVGYRKSPPDIPIHRDERIEVMWTVSRSGLPDWQVAWNYLSRSRLKKQNPNEMEEENLVLESTRVKPGTIVYLNNPDDTSDLNAIDQWFYSRYATYKVLNVRRDLHGKTLKLVPWPLANDIEDQNDVTNKGMINRPYESVSLIEKNRGKAGALNVWAEFLRLRARKWAKLHDVPYPVQTFSGIVDARHMIAEPAIFFNEALPFFARKERGNAYGKAKDVVLIQYPQFFSNVLRDDFLDNKNSGYYTIWQTLRDCSKCCTSSGTNAIWDITDPEFSFATSSRIEDTGTSQKYLAKYLSVHLPCFVAYGIAKDTEDYIEAVYRWSCGAVELFWSTLFSHQFKHFILIASIVTIFGIASFSHYVFSYYLWLGFLVACALMAYYEKATGDRPLRRLNVSATIVMNTMYWFSNLSSLVWVGLVPIRIAIFSAAPVSQNPEQSVGWAFISLILRFPIGIVTDRIINMSSFLSPKTKKDQWNFSMVLWRSSQLFVCSWAYTLLSFIMGSQTAWNAFRNDGDNTMWSSYRVSNDEVTKARKNMANFKTCFSFDYLQAVYIFYRLHVVSFLLAFQMPDIITKWLAACLFILQMICIFVSIAFVNVRNSSYIVTTIIVCALNIFLVADIALLLTPGLTKIIGRPARLEYVFAILSVIIVGSLALSHKLPGINYLLKVVT